MTVSVESNKVSYAGNGATTDFDFTYPIFAESNIRVLLRDAAGVESIQALNTDYTISAETSPNTPIPWPDGGTVTMVTPPASGETLLIKRALPLVQGTDYVEGDAFPAETHEAALDELTMLLQQFQEALSRAFTLAETDAGSAVLPTAALRAAKFLAFDAGGNPIASAGTPDTAVAVSTFMGTLLGLASASALRSAAGIASRNPIINGNMRVEQRGAVTLTNSYQFGKVDRWAVRAAGTVGAGSVTQSIAASVGRTGYALHFSGVTLTGAGELHARYRVESRDARRFKMQSATFAVEVYHDIGSAKNFTILVGKADAADDFSAVTNIDTSAAIGVNSALATTISITVDSMGDCTNGIEIEIKCDCGAVTTKNLYLAEARMEEGAGVPSVEYPPYASVLAQCQRYFYKTFERGLTPAQNTGDGSGAMTTIANDSSGEFGFYITWPVEMRAKPTVVMFNPNAANSSARNATDGTDKAMNVVNRGTAGCAFVELTGAGAGNANDRMELHVTAEIEL